MFSDFENLQKIKVMYVSNLIKETDGQTDHMWTKKMHFEKKTSC